MRKPSTTGFLSYKLTPGIILLFCLNCGGEPASGHLADSSSQADPDATVRTDSDAALFDSTIPEDGARSADATTQDRTAEGSPDGAARTDDRATSDGAGESHVAVGCEGEATAEEIEDTYRIAGDVEWMVWELMGCGAMMVGLALQVQKVPWQFVFTNPIPSPPPMFRAEETYRVQPVVPEGVMDIRFFYGDDYGVGQTGEVIPYDVLQMESYFHGLVIDTSEPNQVTLSWDGIGPLIELLGFGPNPPNPLVVDSTDDLFAELDKLLMQGTLVLDDSRDFSSTVLTARTPRVSVGELLEPGSVEWQLESLDGERAELSQELTLEEWTIQYHHATLWADSELSGQVSYVVEGDHFPFESTIDYGEEPTRYPDVTRQCLER